LAIVVSRTEGWIDSQAPESYRLPAAASTSGGAWTRVPGFCFTIGMPASPPHAERR